MGLKRWSYNLDGHHIEATNYYSFLRLNAWESLKIDGREIQKIEGSILRPSSYLYGLLESPAGPKKIEVVIGPLGFGIGCHILVDGEVVAGDIDKDLNTLHPAEGKRLYNKGFANYLFFRGICRMGIPFGVVMTLLNASNALSSERLILGFITGSVVFGGMMGTFSWWGLKNSTHLTAVKSSDFQSPPN